MPGSQPGVPALRELPGAQPVVPPCLAASPTKGEDCATFWYHLVWRMETRGRKATRCLPGVSMRRVPGCLRSCEERGAS